MEECLRAGNKRLRSGWYKRILLQLHGTSVETVELVQ
jgi:hypothetical protein